MWFLKGVHLAGGLAITLRIFIRKLLLCNNCGKFKFRIIKIRKVCKGCGHSVILDKDSDKITKFIFNKQAKLK